MNIALKQNLNMKQIIFIACALLIGTTINAQSGLGINFSVTQNFNSENSILLGNGTNYEYEFTSKGFNTGYSLGVFHGTNIADIFYFNKSLQLVKESQSFQISNLTDAPFDESTVDRYTIQVPVTAGIKIGALSIGVGPAMNIIASESRAEELDQTFRINQERVSWSGILESNYELNRMISVQFKLIQSFNGASSGYYYNNQPVKLDKQPRQWSAGIIVTPF